MGVYIKGMTKEDLLKTLPVLESVVVEVPEPHGRLIDAEKAIKRMDEVKRNNILVESPLDIERCKCVCRHMPTVIEAEGE